MQGPACRIQVSDTIAANLKMPEKKNAKKLIPSEVE